MKTASHPKREVPADLIVNTPKIINTTTTLQIFPDSIKKYSKVHSVACLGSLQVKRPLYSRE